MGWEKKRGKKGKNKGKPSISIFSKCQKGGEGVRKKEGGGKRTSAPYYESQRRGRGEKRSSRKRRESLFFLWMTKGRRKEGKEKG